MASSCLFATSTARRHPRGSELRAVVMGSSRDIPRDVWSPTLEETSSRLSMQNSPDKAETLRFAKSGNRRFIDGKAGVARGNSPGDSARGCVGFT